MKSVMREGTFTRTQRRYEVQGRNGYHGIDEYTNKGCIRNVDTFGSRKQADLTAGHLGSAYYDGFRDAHIGLILPLFKQVEDTKYRNATGNAFDTPVKTRIPKGTLVKVLGKDSAAFFQCEVASGPLKGHKFEAQFTDLREGGTHGTE